MKVLIISRDGNFLKPEGSVPGDVVARHKLYLERLQLKEPSSEIRIVVLTKDTNVSMKWITNGELAVALIPLNSFLGTFFILFKLLLNPFSQLFRSWIPDMITSQSPLEDGLFALALSRRLHVPYVAQVHFGLAQLRTDFSAGMGIFKRLICDIVLPRARRVRFVSKRQGGEFEQRYKFRSGTTYTVPVAMMFEEDLPSVDREQRPKAPRVIYAGRFVNHKNLSCWLSAARQIADEVPNVNFCMIGEGPQKDELVGLAEDLGLAHQVTFPGFVTTKELADEYRRASVFLLSSDQDAFGRVVAEANAYGLPVVSTRSGGPDEIILPGETGFLERVGDATALARDVVQLLLDDELRKNMGAAARERARRLYDPAILADEIVNGWVSVRYMSPS